MGAVSSLWEHPYKGDSQRWIVYKYIQIQKIKLLGPNLVNYSSGGDKVFFVYIVEVMLIIIANGNYI